MKFTWYGRVFRFPSVSEISKDNDDAVNRNLHHPEASNTWTARNQIIYEGRTRRLGWRPGQVKSGL
jgi:hypothetical protein